MDRNNYRTLKTGKTGCVALRKESVDRNNAVAVPIDRPLSVALRKESVDRNINN